MRSDKLERNAHPPKPTKQNVQTLSGVLEKGGDTHSAAQTHKSRSSYSQPYGDHGVCTHEKSLFTDTPRLDSGDGASAL